MEATEQYFPVLLFIMLFKVVLSFESADEILKCDHLSNSSRVRLYFMTVTSDGNETDKLMEGKLLRNT